LRRRMKNAIDLRGTGLRLSGRRRCARNANLEHTILDEGDRSEYVARMTALFQAHSGLRFLVLLAGAAHVLLCAVSLALKQPYGKPGRILGSAFAGLVHLQVLLGFALVTVRAWYPQLAGHLACM